MTDSRPSGGLWRATPAGIAIRVRLTPRSQRDGIESLEETAEGLVLKARVRAIPESGAANAALERLVAEWLGVPKGTVAVVAGGKSRLKTVAIAGELESLQRQLADRVAEMDRAKSR